MPILERWERSRRVPVARVHVVINGPEKLLEGVGKALIVSTRIMGERTHGRVQQGWVAQQEGIRLVALPEPELIGPFAVPRHGCLRTGDLVADAVLAPRRYLRHGETAPGAAAEVQQDGGVI